MTNQIWVVTDSENGWDCVIGAYDAESEDDVRTLLKSERGVEELDDTIIIKLTHLTKI